MTQIVKFQAFYKPIYHKYQQLEGDVQQEIYQQASLVTFRTEKDEYFPNNAQLSSKMLAKNIYVCMYTYYSAEHNEKYKMAKASNLNSKK